jgi:hypothetical protein
LPKDRFAASNVTRFPLADGEDWVEFKNSLTWGEDMRLTADTSIIETVTEKDEEGEEREEQKARIDWGVYNIHRLAAYLRSWSFVGPDEKTVVPISVESVAGLCDDVGAELLHLLEKHIKEQSLKNSPTSTPA